MWLNIYWAFCQRNAFASVARSRENVCPPLVPSTLHPVSYCVTVFSVLCGAGGAKIISIFFCLSQPDFFLHIYISLCETPDLNSRPLTQKSGALPMSHHIFNGAVAVISNLCSMEFHGLGADKVFSRVNFLLKYKAHLMSFNHFREFT